MKLETEKKTVVLKPTTRKIVEMTKKNKAKNLNEYFFTIVNDGDIEGLANIILEFAETEDGKKGFLNLNEVYNFIDEIKDKEEKTYEGLLKEVGEMINEMGFFNRKMTEKELKEAMENPLNGMDMKKMIATSTEKAITEVVSEEFKGYKG